VVHSRHKPRPIAGKVPHRRLFQSRRWRTIAPKMNRKTRQRSRQQQMTGSKRRKPPHLFWAIASAAALAGCTDDGSYSAPVFPFQVRFAASDRAAPVLLSNTNWWQRLNDPVLDALIARAMVSNLTLEAARERVVQSRAEIAAIPGAASLSPDAQLITQGANGSPLTTVGTGNLGFSWLLDPLGARRSQLKAADARAVATGAEVNAAQLLVILNLANAYVDLRYNQRLLALRSQDLASRRKTLALTQSFLDADSATRLDLVRSQAVVSEIEGQIPGVKAAIAGKKAEIAVLVGMAPGTLPVDLDKGASLPRPHLSPEVGIPADLLRNRPDILIAERIYYAALQDIGAAKAQLYPRLSLGGAISLTSARGNSSTEYFFGPSVQFPPLLSKSPRATVDARESIARQAHTSWKSTVLEGILEVENALLTYSAATAAVNSSDRTVRLYQEAVDLTRDLIAKDGATVSDLIDAESASASAKAVLADNQRQQARAFVALNIALGSGNAYRAAAN